MTPLLALWIDAVVKSSIILLFTLGVATLLRRKSASLRHAIWTTGLLCALAIPLLSVMLPAWRLNVGRAHRQETVAAAIETTTVHAPAVPSAVPAPSAVPVPSRGVAPSSVILRIWLFGLSMVALMLLLEGLKLARVAFGAATVHQESWKELAREVSALIRLRRVARLVRNPNASVLGTWGTLRPRVILPREAEAWSGERMRVVLGHELAHVKRNDWLVQIAAEAARAIYWFNPLFWIACAQLRRESEHACDDTAMRLGVDGPTYASHVLDLARTLKYSGQPGAAALAMANPSNLERRLVAMLNPALNRRTATKGTVALVILVALALTLPLAAMHPQSPPEPSREMQTEKPVATEMIKLPGGFQVASDSLTPGAESIVAGGHVSMRQTKPNTSGVTTIAASSISFAPAAIAQQAAGAISGTVSDPSGALIPGVRMFITDKDSGVVAGTFSNDVGSFAVSGLPPGNYAMTATLPGFQTSKANAISVQPGMNIQVKVNLRISMTVVVDIAVSALPGSCLQLLGTVKTDGTTYTRADCFELNAAERNVPPRNPPSPEPDDIVILGTSPVALPQAQIPATNRQVLRIGGMVEAGNLLFHPNPAYPPEARRIGLEGRVILSATIDTVGNVRSVQVLDSSNPLFNQAPVEAIQNWRFKPTMLNGSPIETTTTITVNYTIGLSR